MNDALRMYGLVLRMYGLVMIRLWMSRRDSFRDRDRQRSTETDRDRQRPTEAWMDELWFACERVMDESRITYDLHVNESWMSHGSLWIRMWRSHGCDMDRLWFACEWVMNESWIFYDMQVNESWMTRNMTLSVWPYGVATMSRLLKITGLFCRISSLL